MIIIHANKNQGKTTQVKQVIQYLLADNKPVMGFYSEKILSNNKVVGYDLVTIPKKVVFPFLSIVKKENQQQIGSFYMDEFTIAEGYNQIKKAIINQADYVIIDEVGKLELNNKGWHTAIEKLLTEFKGEIILSIRTEFVEKVIQKWNLKEVKLITSKQDDFKLQPNTLKKIG